MKRSSILALLLILSSALLGIGCGGSLAPSAAQTTNGIPVTANLGIDYHALHVYSDWGAKSPRIYHEKIWRTSENEYRIECTAIFENYNNLGTWLLLPPSEVEKYNKTLAKGQGYFNVFERGFKITDPDLFLQNYNYSIINPGQPYLDRDAVVVRVTSVWQDRPNYTIWMDKMTGLVLKYIEDTPTMDPLTTMEVTELDLNPDFTGIEFFSSPIQKEQIDYHKGDPFVFKIFEPLYTPPGFFLEEALKVQLYDNSIFRLIYTDGIQRIVISQFRISSVLQSGSMPSPSSGTVNPIIINHTYKAGKSVTVFDKKGTQFDIRTNLSEEEIDFIIESLTQVKKTN